MYEYKIKEVSRVVDGDTVDLIIDLGFSLTKKERVRLAGIDTPESRTRDLEEKELGIEALIEVHNRHELLQALDIGAHLIGINNRNLDDFSENLELTVELSKELPDDIVVISESGIRTIADVRKLLDHNVDGILVGEAFMSGGFDQNKVSKKIRSFMMVE